MQQRDEQVYVVAREGVDVPGKQRLLGVVCGIDRVGRYGVVVG